MPDKDYKWIGRGIYTLSAASRLTRIPSVSISRWLKGYTHYGSERGHDPVIGSGLDRVDGRPSLSFADLIEIQFIAQFRRHKISMKVIRYTAKKAAALIQSDHPFSSKSFRTVGRRIIYDSADETGDRRLLDLYNDQYAIEKIVDLFLKDSLEYEQNQPGQWWPLGLDRAGILDPKRSFGAPIVDQGSVQTSALMSTYFAEDRDADVVAGWYGVSVDAVKDAVEFEQRLAA